MVQFMEKQGVLLSRAGERNLLSEDLVDKLLKSSAFAHFSRENIRVKFELACELTEAGLSHKSIARILDIDAETLKKTTEVLYE